MTRVKKKRCCLKPLTVDLCLARSISEYYQSKENSTEILTVFLCFVAVTQNKLFGCSEASLSLPQSLENKKPLL